MVISRMKFVVILISALLSGCTPGFIYTDIVEPGCTDLRGTPLGEKTVKGGAFRVEIPTSRIDLTAEWDSRAIGDIAKKNGISTVHSCDARVLSFLGGIFRKQEIIVYGE